MISLPPGITLQAVARWAQVSVVTARLVLSAQPGPSAQATARVKLALAELSEQKPASPARAVDNASSDVFAAISHPARRRMLDLLTQAERSVSDIAGHFAMSRPAVSQHLRVLLDAGLVTEQRHGRERRYRLVPERLSPVRDWIAHYERFWDDHLQRLQKRLTNRSKE